MCKKARKVWIQIHTLTEINIQWRPKVFPLGIDAFWWWWDFHEASRPVVCVHVCAHMQTEVKVVKLSSAVLFFPQPKSTVMVIVISYLAGNEGVDEPRRSGKLQCAMWPSQSVELPPEYSSALLLHPIVVSAQLFLDTGLPDFQKTNRPMFINSSNDVCLCFPITCLQGLFTVISSIDIYSPLCCFHCMLIKMTISFSVLCVIANVDVIYSHYGMQRF